MREYLLSKNTEETTKNEKTAEARAFKKYYKQNSINL